MIIKKLTVEHAEAINRVDISSFTKPWSIDTVKTLLNSDSACVFGAFDGEQLIGYIALEWVLDEGSLTNLAVMPEYRRQGIAEALVHELLSNASSLKLQFVTLEVRVSNLPAIGLYQKLSFQQVGKRPAYYSAPCEDALLMTRYFKD